MLGLVNGWSPISMAHRSPKSTMFKHGFVFKSNRMKRPIPERDRGCSSLFFSFQMFLHSHRRLLLHLCRHTISLSKRLPSIVPLESSRYEQIRSISHSDTNKRKILMKINTVLNETNPLEAGEQHADAETFACLSNELILSERMVKFPFHYRCVLEQQWEICSDRAVSKEEWNELYRAVGESTKPVFASVTMLVCAHLKHVERGRSLFHYIEQEHPELLKTTLTTSAAYMHLLASDFFSVPEKKHSQDYSPHEEELSRVHDTFVKRREQVSVSKLEEKQRRTIRALRSLSSLRQQQWESSKVYASLDDGTKRIHSYPTWTTIVNYQRWPSMSLTPRFLPLPASWKALDVDL